MKLYLADTSSQDHGWAAQGAMAQPRLNLTHRILLSYHYYKKLDLDTLYAKYFKPPYRKAP